MKSLVIIVAAVILLMVQFGLIFLWYITRKDYQNSLARWAEASRELDYINTNFSGEEFRKKMDEWEDRYLDEDWECIEAKYDHEDE